MQSSEILPPSRVGMRRVSRELPSKHRSFDFDVAWHESAFPSALPMRMLRFRRIRREAAVF
jgi:hypothetical protein